MSKKYLIIWDKKLSQMFSFYVGERKETWRKKKETILERSDIDISDKGRYTTFESDRVAIYPYYYQSKLVRSCDKCNDAGVVPARTQDLQADFYDCPKCTGGK